MASVHFTASDNYVTDGTTADQTDINYFADDIEDAFEAVEDRLDVVEANQNQAIYWATEDVGEVITEVIGGETVYGYSAEAYKEEAKQWATNAVGTEVDEYTISGGSPVLTQTEYSAKAYAAEAKAYADTGKNTYVTDAGNDPTSDYSALHYSEISSDYADASSGYADASSGYADDSNNWAEASIGGGSPTFDSTHGSAKSWAEGDGSDDGTAGDTEVISGSYSAMHWAKAAEDFYDSAISANNTIVAGDAIDVSSAANVGGGLDYTVSHEDTSSQSSVNNSGNTVIQDITLDTYGHITALASATIDMSDYLPLAGGTITGDTTFTADSTFDGCNLIFDSTYSDPAYIDFGSATHLNGDLDLLSTDSYGGIYLSETDGSMVFGGGTNPIFSGSGITLRASSISRDIRFNYNGGTGRNAFFPVTDNNVYLGDSSYRWAAVYANNGTIQTSDENEKNYKSLEDSSFIYSINPIEFTWKDESDGKVHFGIPARDTYSKLDRPELAVVECSDVAPWGINYSELISPMIKCIQDQKKQIDSQEQRIADLEAKLEALLLG